MPTWTRIYVNDGRGNPTSGTTADGKQALIDKIIAGHQVRVGVGRGYFTVNSLRIYNGEVYAQTEVELSLDSDGSSLEFRDPVFSIFALVSTTGIVLRRKFNLVDGRERNRGVARSVVEWFVDGDA
jgi:hypothetical protein